MRLSPVAQLSAIVVFIFHVAGVAAEQERAIVVHQVTVIDGTGAPARPNQTVVISGGRIAALGDSERVRIPKDARTLTGAGKYLIPGLWDMHVHMRGSRLGNQGSLVQENEALLPVYLANGVTGVREMGGDMVDSVLQWRDEISKGRRLGPRIITCGPKLDGPKPTWPGSIPVNTVEEARAAVRRVKAMGADFVKVYNSAPQIPRDAFLAIIDEARRQGLRVTGHLTGDILFSEASAAGMDFEHLAYILRACSKTERELPAGPTDAKGMQALVEAFDPGHVKALLASFVHHRSWVTPTLDVSIINILNLSDPDPADPRRTYLPEAILRTWSDRANDPRTPKRAPISVELRKQYLSRMQELTRMMQSSGVTLLAGSDTGASNPYEFPGFSLHAELARMVEAGLTPMEAIQAATWNSAKWSGRLSSLGSIESGKVADLVLLDANPLDDIRNTVRISAVFTNGRLLERAHLDQLLRSAGTGTR